MIAVPLRILDVSRRASQLLGFETGGTAPVRVKIMKGESIEVAELAKRNGGDSRVLVAEASSVAKVAAASAVEPTPSAPPSAPISTVSSPRVVAELPPLPEKVRRRRISSFRLERSRCGTTRNACSRGLRPWAAFS